MAMKQWLRRTLIGTAVVALLAGGLAGCGHGPHHGRGWSDERVTEVRGRAVDRISRELALDAAQKARLETLADRLLAQRQALRGTGADPRDELRALVAGPTFDRSQARAWLDRKTAAVQAGGPPVLEAMADFYDSLNPQQQAKVRDWMDRRGHRGWGRG